MADDHRPNMNMATPEEIAAWLRPEPALKFEIERGGATHTITVGCRMSFTQPPVLVTFDEDGTIDNYWIPAFDRPVSVP
ncbi:MAG: hypothetical protein C0421_05830 [Hyphomonas sp.]|uniref:hypothetical protein n=1 Tax=Hyphomonas sp. TaxID=87 RepID=UPI0025BCF387|nr:hypothetical protein [Hyphomonas sp.]MBA4338346.1 hypothetical protein [Hyphomonas sp.]